MCRAKSVRSVEVFSQGCRHILGNGVREVFECGEGDRRLSLGSLD